VLGFTTDTGVLPPVPKIPERHQFYPLHRNRRHVAGNEQIKALLEKEKSLLDGSYVSLEHNVYERLISSISMAFCFDTTSRERNLGLLTPVFFLLAYNQYDPIDALYPFCY